MRKTEVAGVVRLLEDPAWESAEDCAKAIITWLAQDRAKRTEYIGVLQFGESRPAWYVGLGPYPGLRSAEKAVQSHPAAGEAYKAAVVPVVSPEGLAELLRTIDVYERPA